jgi:hypothetical protein
MTARNVVRSLTWTVFLWGIMLSAQTRPVAAQGGPPGVLNGFGLQITQQLSSNAADFPAISTTPGLTFRYDPQTQLFERSSTSLGPVFVERARTIGRGRFEVGVSYLFIDFDKLNGDDVTEFGGPALRTPNAVLSIDKFTLHSHIIPFFATYGITDRWDVSVLFPVVSTFFKSRVSLRIGPTNLLFADTHHATGAGDLLFRTKYRFLSLGEMFHLAVGASTRFPTGEEKDIHGKGDYIFEPFLAASGEYGRFDLHAQTGVEFNFDDSDRNRIRYAGGVAVDLIEQFALTLDLIGSSSLKNDIVRGRAPTFGAAPAPFPGAPMLPRSFATPIKTDIVDLAVGFKGNFGRVTGFVSFFVPVTDDGLRADFIPAGGLQVSF